MTLKQKIGLGIVVCVSIPLVWQLIFLLGESKRQQASRAAARGDIAHLGQLLDAGVSPNAYVRLETDSSWFWIIRQTFQHGDNGAFGKPLILTAAESNNIQEVYFLLEKGANVNSAGGAGETALLQAARHGNLEMAKLLLAHGADPYACYKGGGGNHSPYPAVEALLENARAHWVTNDHRKTHEHRIHPAGDNL
jgi:hypothetical protein